MLKNAIRSTLRATLLAGAIGPWGTILVGCGEDAAPPTQARVDMTSGDEDDDRALAPRPSVPRQEPLLRVRIAQSRDAGRTPIVVDTDEGTLELTLFADGGTAFAARPPAEAMLHAPARITRRSDTWVITTGAGLEIQVDGAMTVELRPPPPDADAVTRLDGVEHPGFVRVVPRDDGTCDIVNHVRMESYLPGVLARELYPQWPREVHAAQAIAARSFAASEHAYFSPRRHFDLSNTTSSQVYVGLAGGPRVLEAVHMTRGRYLAWDGALVPGYYSACCGGTAADARDAIGAHPFNDVAPLHGHGGDDACDDAPRYRWTRTRTRAQAGASLRAWSTARRRGGLDGLRALRAIAADERNPHGRPRSYRITGWFGPEEPEGDSAGRGAEERTVVVAAEAVRQALDFDPRPAAADRLPSAHFTARFTGERIEFEGRGHGHGAGLCQYGARALADRGRDHREILAWYYPGADIVESGAPAPPRSD